MARLVLHAARMEQLSLYFALRRLTRRLTRRTERALADSVAGVTVHSVVSRVLFVGLLPLQAFLADARPLTDATIGHKVNLQRMNERTPAPSRLPARGSSMDSLRVTTTPVIPPVCRPRTADVVVTVGAADAGHAE